MSNYRLYNDLNTATISGHVGTMRSQGKITFVNINSFNNYTTRNGEEISKPLFVTVAMNSQQAKILKKNDPITVVGKLKYVVTKHDNGYYHNVVIEPQGTAFSAEVFPYLQMRNMQQVNALVGRLTDDVEMRYTNNSEAIAKLTLATNLVRWNGNTNIEHTSFIDCMLFGKQAELANQYLKKGNKLCVSGRLEMNVWTNNKGTKCQKLQIATDKITFVGSANASKSDNNDSSMQQQQQIKKSTPNTNQSTHTIDVDINENEIPF